jgi:hypothetical protein
MGAIARNILDSADRKDFVCLQNRDEGIGSIARKNGDRHCRDSPRLRPMGRRLRSLSPFLRARYFSGALGGKQWEEAYLGVSPFTARRKDGRRDVVALRAGYPLTPVVESGILCQSDGVSRQTRSGTLPKTARAVRIAEGV